MRAPRIGCPAFQRYIDERFQVVDPIEVIWAAQMWWGGQ
jgi:hypothetical protein